MSWFRVSMECFKKCSNVRLLSTSSAQKKSELCKGKYVSSDLGMLYPRPKFKTQISISNSVCAKLSLWHLRINSFWRQLETSLEFSSWHLFNIFLCQLGYSLYLEIHGDSFLGIPLCFFWHIGIDSFWRQLKSLLELPAGTLELIPFGAISDLPWAWGFLKITSRGFLFAFPLLGFTMIFCSWGTTYFPVGVLLFLSFLGELHRFFFPYVRYSSTIVDNKNKVSVRF